MARITDIEGIGKENAHILQQFGINTTNNLLNVAFQRKGRKDLAEQTNISEKLILKWLNRADIMRIKGVGEEYSDLLEQAGVDTIKELRGRSINALYLKIVKLNEQNPLVKRLPSEADVADWIRQAQQLKTMINMTMNTTT